MKSNEVHARKRVPRFAPLLALSVLFAVATATFLGARSERSERFRQELVLVSDGRVSCSSSAMFRVSCEANAPEYDAQGMEQHFLKRGWSASSKTLTGVDGVMLDQSPCYVKTFEICFYLFGEEAGPGTLAVASEIQGTDR